MCGRAFATYTLEELLERFPGIGTTWDDFDLDKNFNLSPTQLATVIIQTDGSISLRKMRWGLVPTWAKDLQSAAKYSLINARGEEIFEKRSYQTAVRRRRCLIPLSGFIEWKRLSEKEKIPHAIRLRDKSIMSLAGVWEHWSNPDSQEIIESFSIITIAANAWMQKIHDRMPVILQPQDVDAWLNPEMQLDEEIQPFLKPCSDELLEAYEISKAVNSPRNNHPDVLRRL